MLEKLRVKAIYDDFIANVSLNQEQIKILDMLIAKETIVKISMEVGMSQRSVGYEIRKIKDMFNNYVMLQTYKAILLQ